MARQTRMIGASKEAEVSAVPARRVSQGDASGDGGGRLPERGRRGLGGWGSGVRFCVLVIGVVGAATALRWALDPVLETAVPFITYYLAVVVAALVGGARAGAMATVLSALVADLLFVEPRGNLIPLRLGDWVALGLFAVGGGLVSWMAERVDRARRREAEAVERHRAEEAVRRQAALLNLAHDAIIVRGAGDKITFWNSGAEETYGWSREEALGQFSHVLLKTRFPKPLAELSAEVAGKGRWEGELTHTRKDGREIVVASRWAVERDRDGRQVGVLEINRDVTERKRSEEAAREAQARTERILSSITDAFFALDQQWRFTYVNAQAERLLRRPARELLGGNVWELFRGAEAFRQRYEEAVGSGRTTQFEEFYEPLETWFEVHAYPGADGLSVYFRDVTERKRAEEALRQSEERLRLVLEGACAGVWEVRFEPRAVYWSPEYRRLYGFGAEEPPSEEAWARCVHPEDLPRLRENVRIQLEHGEGRGWKQEFRMRHPVRGERWIETLALVRRDAGRAVSYGGIDLDITEQKEAQAVLARSKEDLARLVDERTAKLQEMVGELEHFSYTITHDMRAPLRAMMGYAELMGKVWTSCQEQDARRFLELIGSSALRMDALITDALQYSKAVRQELEVAPVDAGALLRGMLDSYPELQPSKARIKVKGEIPRVMGNAAGLTQCFSNLLGNAVKFAKPGEMPEVVVWAEVRGEAGKWVRIWVEDKGIGIPGSMLPRVFDMFSRGHKEYEGTGIGLALVRKVVDRMGGRVGVESEEGKGSRFWIELKLGEPRLRVERSETRPAEPKGGTVLYVEDEQSDTMFMGMAFAEKGMESALRVVGDGRAAIEYLSEAGKYADRKEYPLPSVVLLDLNLPQVHGFEVLKWMRNHPDFARTPVVVFSSSTREEDRVKALELGANEFVGKPSSGLKFGEVVEGLRDRWLNTPESHCGPVNR